VSLDAWQIALRREFGAEQAFEHENIGAEPVFSEYSVTNPKSRRTYRVTIRGERPGESRCTCPDFAVNTLGTCKHIEFLLARIRKRRGGKAALKRGWQPTRSEVWLLHGARRRIALRLAVDASPALRALAARYFDVDGILKSDSVDSVDQFLAEAATEIACDDEVREAVAAMRDARHRRAVVAEKYASDAALADLLATRLFPYQCEGVRFIASAGRALLGDEMGLGKTIQALASAELMAREFGVERVLIVCPASLKHQWRNEIEKFTRRDATVVSGLTHQRAAGYGQRSFFTIVNYDVLHKDLEAISRLAPDLVILDEAQRIKNWRTRAAGAVKSIRSPYALVLTGTPLENRLEELYSLVQFVDQQRLGPLFRFIHNHQRTDGESSRVVGYENLRQIGETLRPILLRRRKKEVLGQLPERTDKTFFVPMTPDQRVIHEENRETVARLVAKWRHHNFLTEADQLRLQIALQRMRMSCDDAFLVDDKKRAGAKVAELETLLGELLEDPATRVVVFSQWTRMHHLVREMLEARGWGYAYLHGGVPSRDREQLLRRFREPDTRVFLSTDAGGTGLNLQHASVVVNLDLPWNPAVLEQRIGRVHRLGQKRNVLVVNFVSEGTIEQGMLKLLGFKQSLFSGVLDGGDDAITLEGSHLSRFMQTVETVHEATPEAHDEPVSEPAEAVVESRDEEAPPSPKVDDLSALFEVGATLLKGLGQALSASSPSSPLGGVALEREPSTGQVSLKIPLPSPEVASRLVQAAAPLLDLLRGLAAGSATSV
jgi:superfamily II DNA or RNA helicase